MDESKPFGVEYVPPGKRAKIVDGRVYAGKVTELPPGKAKAIALDKFSIAVFNVNGEFFAIKDACPHAEYPLSKGVVTGDEVTCSSHSWKFNIKSGQCTRGTEDLTIRTFKVVVEGDSLWIVI
ncbi:MAG: non-heme iron oxygenase ferredoxin subunit [Deltaproteobacteria bacterium]|nr:non-heme iron oxygenase ferredoxin subunit [Deltaproteobacteria bacterium]